MIAADRETIAIAGDDDDMQIGTRQREAGAWPSKTLMAEAGAMLEAERVAVQEEPTEGQEAEEPEEQTPAA